MVKASDISDLKKSVKDGKFTKDGSHLVLSRGSATTFNNRMLKSLVGGPATVEEDFNVAHNKLTSLEGAPSFPLDNGGMATGNFICSFNQLTSLEGAPYAVFDFTCNYNKLTSLEGCPKYINGTLNISDNLLSNLKDIHKHIQEVGQIIMLTGNPLKSHVLGLLKIEELTSIIFSDNVKLERIINKYLPEGDIFECQQELIDAGFEEYAQL